MKPRDRVRTALSHERPDRCPLQIGFTPEFAKRLRVDMDLDPTRYTTGKFLGNGGDGKKYTVRLR
jgi:hypothetical protein